MIFTLKRTSHSLSLGLVEIGAPKNQHSLATLTPLCFLLQPTTQSNQANTYDQLNQSLLTVKPSKANTLL